MTAYAITQTNRFKAAVIYEGGRLYLTMPSYFGSQPKSWRNLAHRDLLGVRDPFDPAERARLVEESPGLNVHRVQTPTLLLYGARANAENWAAFFHSLLRFDTPASLFVYDEGHGFSRPAAIADNLTRTGEWLDYWVREIAFPDPVRAAEYGQREWSMN